MAKISKKHLKKLAKQATQETSNSESAIREVMKDREEKSRKRKKRILLATAIAGVLILGAVAGYMSRPGKWDDFAKCLTEKGAVMYGENWCPFTNAQKAMFGKSFKYIHYEVKKDLKVRPTWIINGTKYETVQSFQRLSELTGCPLEGGNKK